MVSTKTLICLRYICKFGKFMKRYLCIFLHWCQIQFRICFNFVTIINLGAVFIENFGKRCWQVIVIIIIDARSCIDALKLKWTVLLLGLRATQLLPCQLLQSLQFYLLRGVDLLAPMKLRIVNEYANEQAADVGGLHSLIGYGPNPTVALNGLAGRIDIVTLHGRIHVCIKLTLFFLLINVYMFINTRYMNDEYRQFSSAHKLNHDYIFGADLILKSISSNQV